MKRDSATKEAAGRGGESKFDKLVDALARFDGEPRGYERPLERSFATVAPTARPDLDVAFNPGERWDEALDWIGEPVEPARAAKSAKPASEAAAAKPAKLLSDDPEAIAAELGLNDSLSPAALNRARRRFMWENHPDRRRDLSRELANRRVAIANMLIDRALARPRGGVSRRS